MAEPSINDHRDRRIEHGHGMDESTDRRYFDPVLPLARCVSMILSSMAMTRSLDGLAIADPPLPIADETRS
jgi:hypothetical protein